MVKFNHLFLVNPRDEFDLLTLKAICDKYNFPLSQIYVFGDKQQKTFYKERLLPYWKTDDISSFLDKYKKVLNLKGRIFAIVDSYNTFENFGKYIEDIELLYVKLERTQMYWTMDSIASYNFRCTFTNTVNFYQCRSMWER